MKRHYMDSDWDVDDTESAAPAGGFGTSASFELFQQGAEARLFKGTWLGRPVLVKERLAKPYRHPDLDARLTGERMRSELRCLQRCRQLGVPTPAVLMVDSVNNRIYMWVYTCFVCANTLFCKIRLGILSKTPSQFASVCTISLKRSNQARTTNFYVKPSR